MNLVLKNLARDSLYLAGSSLREIRLGLKANYKILVYLCATILVCTSCIYYPKKSDRQRYSTQCPMVTRMWTLDSEYVGYFAEKSPSGSLIYDESYLVFMLVAEGAVSAYTLVVAGSFVVVGLQL